MTYIDLSGIKIHYTTKGSGDPLVILPDNLLTAQAYQGEIDHFAPCYQVFSLDYPGSGKSSHEWMYFDEIQVDFWGFLADLICHWLLELKIDSCYMIGTGGGALVALHFAGKQARQHNLSATGIVADHFLADWDSRTLHRWLDVREDFYVRNDQTLQDQHGEDWRQVVDRDTNYLRTLADRGGYTVSEGILNAIRCPVLLTGHLQDPVLPGVATEYARLSSLIPDCSIFLSSDANHPFLERPFMWSDRSTYQTVSDQFLSRVVGKKSGS